MSPVFRAVRWLLSASKDDDIGETTTSLLPGDMSGMVAHTM